MPKITEPLNLLKEIVEDDVEQLRLAADPDARLGHKSADSAFFGYKTHLAMTEERIITAGKNQADTYYFDVEICKRCPFKGGCYKKGSRSKTYSVSIKSDAHSEQMAFHETAYFKVKFKERYKIEAKNSELKHGYGYDVATSSGLLGMQLQGGMTIFAVNLKRILKLAD
ncbi:Transposase DDE domain-containing protein [Paenibacillus sp. UNCCL117]|nr:Transposase DDE domain-containing protein [Paenibacillus sp. cl123]SFW24670.1 Transposase DDE domain-containing protein [Paenibacillus sp. UNCCL117]